MDRRRFIQSTSAAAAAAAAIVGANKAGAAPVDVKTDLLIIGSGFAGLWAAVTAQAGGVKRIAVADKGSIGLSGQSRMAAANTIVCMPRDNPDVWLKDFVEAQGGLCRQDMVMDLIETSYDRIKKLESWGVKYALSAFRMNSRGLDHAKKRMRARYKDMAGGRAIVAGLLDRVESGNAALFPKTMVTSLLGKNGRAAGAAGVHRITGEPVVFSARAVIVAGGDCSFRGNYPGVDQSTGDAFALGYKAGAGLSNMEFLGSNTNPIGWGMEGTGPVTELGAKFLDKNHKSFMENYRPEADNTRTCYIAQAMAAEAEKGNGPPFYLDMRPLMFPGIIERGFNSYGGWIPLNHRRLKEAGIDVFDDVHEWAPAVQTLRGGIRTDIDCMSDVQGLFAAGISQALDPGLFGGWSSARAMWSGERAGMAAARFLKDAEDVSPDKNEVRKERRKAVEALERKTGPNADRVCESLQNVIFPYAVSIRKSAATLEKALAKTERIRYEDVPAMKASDPHELVKVHETRNMVLVAETFLRASLSREESRGDHFRADFPDTDNNRWLKWVNLKRGAKEAMEISFERIPVEKYPFQPKDVKGV